MGPLYPLRPFHEAALALFSAGASPAVVAIKFRGQVSTSTIYRWYQLWADYKGIDASSQLEKKRGRKKRYPEYGEEVTSMRRAMMKKRRENETMRKYPEYFENHGDPGQLADDEDTPEMATSAE